MCDSSISEKCTGERASRLGDGRWVCPLCAPHVVDAGPDLPLDLHEATGNPRNLSWEMTTPVRSATSSQSHVTPINKFDPGHTAS